MGGADGGGGADRHSWSPTDRRYSSRAGRMRARTVIPAPPVFPRSSRMPDVSGASGTALPAS
eukprot:scaffold4032_cov126-Isochrysis_galbana.AAC.1